MPFGETSRINKQSVMKDFIVFYLHPTQKDECLFVQYRKLVLYKCLLYSIVIYVIWMINEYRKIMNIFVLFGYVPSSNEDDALYVQ